MEIKTAVTDTKTLARSTMFPTLIMLVWIRPMRTMDTQYTDTITISYILLPIGIGQIGKERTPYIFILFKTALFSRTGKIPRPLPSFAVIIIKVGLFIAAILPSYHIATTTVICNIARIFIQCLPLYMFR